MKYSVKTKLIVFTLIAVLAAAAAFAFISHSSAKRAAETVAVSLIDRSAAAAADNLSGKIKAVTAVSDDLSGNDAAFNRAADQIRLLLLEIRNKSYGAQGIKFDIAYSDELVSIDGVTSYKNSEAVRSAAAGKPLLSAPVCDGNKNTVCYASPLEDDYGGRKCVLVCTAECGFFDDVFEGVSLGESCAVYVTDENGVIAGEASENPDVYSASADIDERNGWTLHVEAVPAELMPDLTSETVVTAGIFAALAAALCIIIAAVLNGTLSPIKSMAERISKLAEGDFSSPVPKTRSKDESYEIACALEKTAAALNGCVKEITASISSVADGDISEGASPEKGVYAGDFAMIHGALSDMKKSLRKSFLQVRKASESVIEDAEKLDRLSCGNASAGRVVPLLDKDAESLFSGRTDISAYAGEASAELEAAHEKLSEEREKLTELAGAITAVNRYADDINGVISQIDDIAFRTNILALNAAVEAASAGENGRSFAVVADEVRNLAQRSSEAAKSTTELIEKTVSAISGGAALARESGLILDEIMNRADKASGLMDGIKSAAEEYEGAAKSAEETIYRLSEQASAAGVSAADTEKTGAIVSEALRLREIADSFKTK